MIVPRVCAASEIESRKPLAFTVPPALMTTRELFSLSRRVMILRVESTVGHLAKLVAEHQIQDVMRPLELAHALAYSLAKDAYRL